MLGLFKRDDPIQRTQTTLDEKRGSREKLASRLNDAQGILLEKRAAAEQLALAGADDDALDRAEIATRAAIDRIETLTAALARLDEQIAEYERELAAAKAERDREVVAAELERMAATIKQTAPPFDAAALALVQAITKNAAAMTDATTFAANLDGLRRSVTETIPLLVSEIIASANLARTGQARIGFRTERDDPIVDVRKLDAAKRVLLDG